jgi:hypothetical protein
MSDVTLTAPAGFADMAQVVLTSPEAHTLLDQVQARVKKTLAGVGLTLVPGTRPGAESEIESESETDAASCWTVVLERGRTVAREVLLVTQGRNPARPDYHEVLLRLILRSLPGGCMLQVKIEVRQGISDISRGSGALVATCDAALRSWGAHEMRGHPEFVAVLHEAVRDLAENPGTWDGAHFTVLAKVLRPAP